MEIKYSDEKNVQMLISILKHNNIKKVIASPGTNNIGFVASIQNDPFFEIYSCVDERSACYMAVGLSAESGEPVIITCTGATASRNYMPGLTEAYYRKLPILAVTCGPHTSKIGNNVPQVIDRTATAKDVVKLSVHIPTINSIDDELGCNILLNRAILELKHNGGGPVHINLVVLHSGLSSFNVEKLPETRFIDRIQEGDAFPDINSYNKIGIFVGNHKKMTNELVEAIDEFCEKYNCIVLCDYTSNYYGKYRIMPNIICDQEKYQSSLNNFDLLIHIGEVSGAYVKITTKEVWRVNPDGEIKDTFSNKLKYVFQMKEEKFFKEYNKQRKETNISSYSIWKKEETELEELAYNCKLPFSNLLVAQNIIKKLPEGATLHLAILNSLRSYNYFVTDKFINGFSNTGGFGIDGPMSTLIGASLSNPNKLFFGVIGDLAFFYDLNSLGNRNIKNNVRIILINNGCGTEFHNYSHSASKFGEMANDYIAADGHFGNKSILLVKSLAESLGFEYLTANNEEELLEHIDYFTSNTMYEKPIIFEIFTNSTDESNALKMIRNLKISSKGLIEDFAKTMLGPKTKKVIKKILKR